MTFDSNRHTRLFQQASKLFLSAVLLLGLGACDNNGSNSPSNKTSTAQAGKTVAAAKTVASENILYKYVVVKEKISSPASPLGYWDISLRYPEVINLADASRQTEINRNIKQLVDKYKCPTVGEQAFESEVTLATKQLISFKYNAMWLCEAMSHPDSNSGAVTFDLARGKHIRLSEEVVNAASYDKLKTVIKNNIDKILAEKKTAGTHCPAPDSLTNYYLTKNNIVFRASYTLHSDSACEIEAGIDYATLRE